MPDFTIMTYNIGWMNRMFKSGKIKDSKLEQAESAAEVISRIKPDILGICEAANERTEHEHFIEHHLDNEYSVCMGKSRGGQNLVFYYRDRVQEVSVDADIDRYEPWIADVDLDEIEENHKWEREPLEATFRLDDGPEIRMILLHTKSKIVASVVDFHNFQNIALANRKKLVAQAWHLRKRIDDLLTEDDALPLVVMGDMNDGPGLDPFEKMVGTSFVETVMGSVFEPDKILHNSLYWMKTHDKADVRKQLWTADFPDPIVSTPFGGKHQVWLDHILVSPDMQSDGNPVRYVKDSGSIGEKDSVAGKASDHYPVYCRIRTA